MPRSACPLQLLVKYSGVALTDHYEASGKNALDRTGTALGYLWDFWVKNISGSPQYIKKAPRRSIVGGGGHPPGGRAFPTAWGLQQLVMENHSAIRGLKISHRGACALPVDCVAECRRGEAGRALSRPTRRSCGRGARVLPGQPGPQRLRSAFAAPDPAPNDERMGLRGSNCQG